MCSATDFFAVYTYQKEMWRGETQCEDKYPGDNSLLALFTSRTAQHEKIAGKQRNLPNPAKLARTKAAVHLGDIAWSPATAPDEVLDLLRHAPCACITMVRFRGSTRNP